MNDNLNIALLGTTTLIRKSFLDLVKKNKFSIKNMFFLDEKNNSGKKFYFNKKTYSIIDVNSFNWSKVNLVFSISKKKCFIFYLKKAEKMGCIIIDASGFFLLKKNIPIIIPKINSDILFNFPIPKIISISDSEVTQLIFCIKPILELVNIKKIVVTNLLPASFFGKKKINTLAKQSANLLNGTRIEQNSIEKQIAFNVISPFNYSSDAILKEGKFIKQVQNILQDYSFKISVNFFQVPVFYGITQIVCVETSYFIHVKEIFKKFSEVSHINIIKEGKFLSQFENGLKNNLILGCIKNNFLNSNLINFCSISDNIQFGIVKMLIEILKIIQKNKIC